MKTLAEPASILVVEDNPADLFLIEEMLRSSRLSIKHIYSADHASTACELLMQHDISLILLDLSLPDSFGIDTFLKIKETTNKIPVIILTGMTDSDVALKTLKLGAQDYLVKGEFDIPLLVKSAEYSIERKKVEEKIIASEEKYRQMFYKNPFPAFIYDMDGFQILEVNDAAIEKYGYDRTEFLTLTLKDIRPSEDIPEMLESVTYRGRPDKSKEKIWRHKKKNGDLMLVEVTFYEIDYFDKKAMQSQINDVTEKVRLQKRLEEERLIKQKQITDAVLKAQEKERKGIGQELHDNINQILAATRLYLSESLVSESKRTEYIHTSLQSLSMAIEEIRKLSKALIIPGFIKSGLKQSVEDLVGHILMARQMHITLDMEKLEEGSLSESLKINLYRIIQEQLNNILKYADASSVTICIHTMADTVMLSVIDNGKGFDTSVRTKGVGITNINSRAELFNGKVKIDSAPGQGCRLDVVLCTTATPQQAA